MKKITRKKYELDPGPGRADKLSPFIRLLPVRQSIDSDNDDDLIVNEMDDAEKEDSKARNN